MQLINWSSVLKWYRGSRFLLTSIDDVSLVYACRSSIPSFSFNFFFLGVLVIDILNLCTHELLRLATESKELGTRLKTNTQLKRTRTQKRRHDEAGQFRSVAFVARPVLF